MALNDLIDHGIVSDDIVGEAAEGDLDFDDFIQNSIELALKTTTCESTESDSMECYISESDDSKEPITTDPACECESEENTEILVGVTITHMP